MSVFGGIGFTAPWLLLALMALPILWLILRAVGRPMDSSTSLIDSTM